MDHYKKIFKDEFDAELFIRLIDVFNTMAIDQADYANQEEHNFVGKFVELIA